ncbi:hypothetical protein SAMN02745866_02985 [Alteromonadaceae bacterium Bs31]|nr:hypothetical protein SAMN02745866_02985 [Alteromonadaceae bacterium Bs31]
MELPKKYECLLNNSRIARSFELLCDFKIARPTLNLKNIADSEEAMTVLAKGASGGFYLLWIKEENTEDCPIVYLSPGEGVAGMVAYSFNGLVSLLLATMECWRDFDGDESDEDFGELLLEEYSESDDNSENQSIISGFLGIPPMLNPAAYLRKIHRESLPRVVGLDGSALLKHYFDLKYNKALNLTLRSKFLFVLSLRSLLHKNPLRPQPKLARLVLRAIKYI